MCWELDCQDHSGVGSDFEEAMRLEGSVHLNRLVLLLWEEILI